MINRAALLIKFKEPALKWINEADPDKDSPLLTLNEVNEDRTVFLIDDEDAETEKNVDAWIEENFIMLYQYELADWYNDEDLIPKNITLELFREWFEVEVHSEIIDTVRGEKLIDEDL